MHDYTQAELDPQTRGMLDFAVKLTREPSSINEADVQELRDLGLRDEQVLSVVLITCLFSFLDRLADGLGLKVPAAREEAVQGWLSGPATGLDWLVGTASGSARKPALRDGGRREKRRSSEGEGMVWIRQKRVGKWLALRAMLSNLLVTPQVVSHTRRSPVLRTMSINPAAMVAVGNFVDAVTFGASALTRPQEEAIAVAVSVANKCRF